MAVVVGLSGRKQSGKNTVCDYLLEQIDVKCKIYSFADSLKRFCIDVMGLREEQCYGSDEDKNSITIYTWDNMTYDIQRSYAVDGVMPAGQMTAREIMQVFGTDVMRDMFDKDIWVKSTFNLINSQDVDVAFIADTRFPSEVNAIKDQDNGYVIRLTRKVADDCHVSETALDDYDFSVLGERACMIDNQDMTIEEQNEIAWNFLKPILEGK